MRRRWYRLGVVALATVAAACGSSRVSGSDLTRPQDPTTTSLAVAAPATATTATLPIDRPTTPIEPSGKRLVDVGETGTANGVDVTIDRVWFDNCAGTLYQAAPGNTILFVQATLTNNTASTTARYGALDWTLEDALGQTYNASITTCHDEELGLTMAGHELHRHAATAMMRIAVRARAVCDVPAPKATVKRKASPVSAMTGTCQTSESHCKRHAVTAS